jgi:hypothetical protein
MTRTLILLLIALAVRPSPSAAQTRIEQDNPAIIYSGNCTAMTQRPTAAAARR